MNEQHSHRTEDVAAQLNARMIPVDRVVVGERLRPLSTEHMEEIAESIQVLGLLQPIVVQQADDGYPLIAGWHRLEAAKLLGWREIGATVRDLDEVDRRLAEIDENLVRHELIALDVGIHTAERKHLYLRKYPETKRGTAGAKAKHGSANEMISFAKDTALKTGRTERSVQQDAQIGERIPKDVQERLRGSAIEDSKTDLLALSRLAEEAQREVVATVDLSNKAEIREAIESHLAADPLDDAEVEAAEVGSEPPPNPAQPVPSHRAAPKPPGGHAARRRPTKNADGATLIEIAATVAEFARAIADVFTTEEKRELLKLIERDLDEISRRQALMAYAGEDAEPQPLGLAPTP